MSPPAPSRTAATPAGSTATGAALVTGAGRGIGRAVAEALARGGRRVVLVSRTAEEIASAAGAINASLGGQADLAFAFPADVTDESSVERCLAMARAEIGDIDVLVNAAGAAASAPYERTSDALLQRLMAVNLMGAHHTMSRLLAAMIQRRSGRVINIASAAGLQGFAYASAYAASKHALIGLTRSVALEVAGSGVRINAVCPFFVDTPLLDASIEAISTKTGRTREEARESLARMNPTGRLLEAGEVAHAVLWLLSEEASGLNGEAIVVDGRPSPWSGGPSLAVNPESLGQPIGYSNGTLARAGRTLFVAGQVAWDRDHRIVGGDDFAAQFETALANVIAVVRDAGGRPDQIGRLRIYVSDRDRYLAALNETGRAYRRLMGAHFPAMALVEVKRLLEEGALVEIEAEAIL